VNITSVFSWTLFQVTGNITMGCQGSKSADAKPAESKAADAENEAAADSGDAPAAEAEQRDTTFERMMQSNELRSRDRPY